MRGYNDDVLACVCPVNAYDLGDDEPELEPGEGHSTILFWPQEWANSVKLMRDRRDAEPHRSVICMGCYTRQMEVELTENTSDIFERSHC